MTLNRSMACLVLALLGQAVAAQPLAGEFAPEDYAQPVCPAYHTVSADKKTCVRNAEAVKALDEPACKAAGFTVTEDAATKAKACSADKSPLPLPGCRPLSAHTAKFNAERSRCEYTPAVPKSAQGDYISDCIRIKNEPPGSGLRPGQVYIVTEQEDRDDDRMLTLVPGELFIRCKAAESSAPPTRILASTLSAHSASRYGWAYGALVMPYKYYPSTRRFSAGVPLGLYGGWRYGQTGSGVTIAAAFTIGQVEADTIDPVAVNSDGSPVVTGRVQTSALSTALGAVFDVTKRPGAKSFKAGVFIGEDRVNEGPTLRYPENRKTWIAIQLGFDFTDW